MIYKPFAWWAIYNACRKNAVSQEVAREAADEIYEAVEPYLKKKAKAIK